MHNIFHEWLNMNYVQRVHIKVTWQFVVDYTQSQPGAKLHNNYFSFRVTSLLEYLRTIESSPSVMPGLRNVRGSRRESNPGAKAAGNFFLQQKYNNRFVQWVKTVEEIASSLMIICRKLLYYRSLEWQLFSQLTICNISLSIQSLFSNYLWFFFQFWNVILMNLFISCKISLLIWFILNVKGLFNICLKILLCWTFRFCVIENKLETNIIFVEIGIL